MPSASQCPPGQLMCDSPFMPAAAVLRFGRMEASLQLTVARSAVQMQLDGCGWLRLVGT